MRLYAQLHGSYFMHVCACFVLCMRVVYVCSEIACVTYVEGDTCVGGKDGMNVEFHSNRISLKS